jgi:Mn-dependent DtxR family transcriptional regulator
MERADRYLKTIYSLSDGDKYYAKTFWKEIRNTK